MNIAMRLKIGEVSKQAGVAVGAIRYYESIGLLQSERGENGYRYYGDNAIGQIQFIKKAQSLGFSLEEIGEILTIHQQGDMPCERVQSLLQDKIDQIAAQIKEMQSLKQGLERYRDRWATAQPTITSEEICPLIETVAL